MIDFTDGEYPIIIKPNFGQPLLLNLRDYKDEDYKLVKNVVFEALLIAVPNQSTQRILEQFYLNIYLQPILRDKGKFNERRGELLPLNILEIESINKLDFRDQPILEEENCIVWDIFNSLLQVDDVFGKRKKLFKIIFQIPIEEVLTIQTLLETSSCSFVLFDIVHDIPNLIENKVNYHSIAFYDKDWSNFKFIHATDFHVARRNDFIINFVKDKVRGKVAGCGESKNKLDKFDDFILYRDFEFKEGFQEDRYDELKTSKFNFNYQLRKFIEFSNDKAINNELDFVLMTGDLVDYLNIGRGNFQYKNNMYVFNDILLGRDRGTNKPPFYGKDPELINSQEIIVPVFTTVGNHDYRKEHYGLRFGEIRKIFGLTKSDIKGYYDIKFFNYFTALYSNLKFLKDYFRLFNPNQNYYLRIGDQYNFIFLDTGQESVADLHDLLKGGPSTIGIKDYQVDLLRAFIKLSHDGKIIVMMHTPPVSPNLSHFKRRKYKKMLGIKRRELKWEDFYEDNLKKYNKTGRIDTLLNMKYQTIMYNWGTFLEILTGSDEVIRRKVDIVICGHTHTLKEYRLKEAKKTERINFGFWFLPLYIEAPCEIYTSIYSDKFEKFSDPKELEIWFDVNKPLVFQTQALGPISATFKFKPPGFRYFVVKNNQITAAKVITLYLK